MSRFVRVSLSTLASLLFLSACASVSVERSLQQLNEEAAAFTQGKLGMAQSAEQQQAREAAAERLLAEPLSRDQAVQLALVNSPALQVLLAEHMVSAAQAAQGGRISNPLFTFERMRFGSELELGRLLSIGLLDLITLPRRYDIAQSRQAQVQLKLTADVVEHITQARHAWVNAVAAQQSLVYAQQVYESAEASAELAKRMLQAGNFSKLQRARQQAFYADAATQLALAQHTATSTREQLVRMLGLSDTQLGMLRLPDRLPELPKAPLDAQAVSSVASKGRLDVRMARAELDAAGKQQGLSFALSLTDIELGVRYDTVFDKAADSAANRRGYEIGLRLPIFDSGDIQRSLMNAQTLAAMNRLQATLRNAGSHLRDSYSAYRTSYDVARHYQDEVVPLRKAIADENLLRYNGMLIGVFELMADSREQVMSVVQAIDTTRQFWLAEAALQASLVGSPGASSSSGSGALLTGGPRSASSGEAAH